MSTCKLDPDPSGVNPRVIIFQCGLAARLGSDAGLLLSQVLYWHEKKPHPDGFWHSLAQWKSELGCDWSRRRHTRALKQLVGAGVMRCTHRDGRETRYLPNLPAIEKLLAKSTDVRDLYETLLETDRVKANYFPLTPSSTDVSSDTTPYLAGNPVQSVQGSEQTLCNPYRVAPDPVQSVQGLPEEQKKEEKYQTEQQKDCGADAAVELVVANQEVRQECPTPEKQPDLQPTPIPPENSQSVSTSHPPVPMQPTSPAQAADDQDDLDYGDYSINSIQSPITRALLASALASQACARRARA